MLTAYCCDGNLRIPVFASLHSLVAGDRKVPAVSAASIIAKVHRDALMTRMHDEAPHYNWARTRDMALPTSCRDPRVRPASRAPAGIPCVGPADGAGPDRNRRSASGRHPRLWEPAEPRSVGAAAAAAAATTTAAAATAHRWRSIGDGSGVDGHPADQRHARPALAARAHRGDFAIGHRAEQLEHGRASRCSGIRREALGQAYS